MVMLSAIARKALSYDLDYYQTSFSKMATIL